MFFICLPLRLLPFCRTTKKVDLVSRTSLFCITKVSCYSSSVSYISMVHTYNVDASLLCKFVSSFYFLSTLLLSTFSRSQYTCIFSASPQIINYLFLGYHLIAYSVLLPLCVTIQTLSAKRTYPYEVSYFTDRWPSAITTYIHACTITIY